MKSHVATTPAASLELRDVVATLVILLLTAGAVVCLLVWLALREDGGPKSGRSIDSRAGADAGGGSNGLALDAAAEQSTQVGFARARAATKPSDGAPTVTWRGAGAGGRMPNDSSSSEASYDPAALSSMPDRDETALDANGTDATGGGPDNDRQNPGDAAESSETVPWAGERALRGIYRRNRVAWFDQYMDLTVAQENVLDRLLEPVDELTLRYNWQSRGHLTSAQVAGIAHREVGALADFRLYLGGAQAAIFDRLTQARPGTAEKLPELPMPDASELATHRSTD